jgi:hypothetical protein
MPDHPQVHISLGEREAEVDEGIAELILELWRQDIDTTMSCQDNNGRVWADFPSASDAEHFLDLVAGDYDDEVYSLYNRLVHEVEDEDWETFRAEHAWQYDCAPVDYNSALYDDEGGLEKPAEDERFIQLHVSVRFPRYDYDEVLRRMKASKEEPAPDDPAGKMR